MKPLFFLLLLGFVPSISVLSQINCKNWLRINGSPDGVRIGDLDITGNKLTVEAVFNRTAPYSPSYAYAGDIVSKHVGPADCNYLLRPRHAEITTTNGFYATPPACDFQLNKTYHVAMVYDGATLKFYRNGFLMSQLNATGNLVTNNWVAKIGETAGLPYNTSTTSLVGYINEVRIWNVARTQAQLKMYMNGSIPTPATQTGLLAYYTFDNLQNKQGNTAWNGSINGNSSINATNPSCILMTDSCSITVPSAQLCTGSLGDPVVNITFGSGSNPGQPISTIVPGASTTYPYVAVSGNPATPTVFDGQYTITNNVIAHPAWFSGAIDHTPNDVNGFMAFFNASESPGEFYKQTVTGLCENTRYEFAAWIANVLNPAALNGVKPDITFVIQKTDGTTLASYVTGPVNQRSTLTWEQFGFFFATPPGVNSVVLKMINTNVGGNAQPGNDFAIDDITLRPCGPALNSSFSSSSVVLTKSQCGFAPVPLFGTASSGYSSPNYLWQISVNNGTTWTDLPSSNSLNYTYTPTSVGAFLFRVLSGEGSNINSPGCRLASNSITLTVTEPPQLSFSGNTICPGQQGQLQFQISGGVSPYTVVISNGTVNTTFSNVLANAVVNVTPNPVVTTTYSIVSLTDAAGCVRTSDFINSSAIVTLQSLTVSVNQSATICVGDSLQMNATGGLQYHWFPATGLSNPNIANPKASPLTTTSYKVIVTGSGGCKDSANTMIVVDSKPLLNLTTDLSACVQDSVQLLASGAANYLWSPSSGLSNPNLSNPVAVIDSTITYTVTGSSANGCSASRSITISALPKPVVIANADTSVCDNGIVQLQATGAQQFQWFPAIGLSDPLISNPVATVSAGITYFVEGTGANGCKAIDSTVIQVYAKPLISVSNDTTVCEGITVPVSAGGAQQYQWSPAAGLSASNVSNPLATVDSTILYTVTGTSADGCSDSKTIQLTALPKPVLTTSVDTAVCPSQTVQLNVSGGQFYQWSPAIGLSDPSVGNPLATIDSTITYTVTGTAAGGCSASKGIVLSALPKPTLLAGADTSLCENGTIQLSATGAQQYQWFPTNGLSDPFVTNPVATVTAGVTYFVEGIGANGCKALDSTVIRMHPKPVVTVSNDTTVCEGVTVPVSAGGAQQYQWFPSVGLSSANISNPLATVDSTITYIVTGTSLQGCSGNASVKLSALPKPVLVASNDTSICPEQVVQLFVSGGQQYQWSPAVGLSDPTIMNPTSIVDTSIVYTVTGSSANGCNSSKTIFITALSKPIVHANNDTAICGTAPVQLVATGAQQYQWSPATGLNNASIANPVATVSSDTRYNVLGIGANGCQAKDSVFITSLARPVVALTNDTTVCQNKPLQLFASGAQQYVWQPALGLTSSSIANPIATLTNTTTYTVTGTATNGCTGTGSVVIGISPQPVLRISTDTTICSNGSANLFVSGAQQYQWYPATGLSNATIANPVATPPVKTKYYLVGSGVNGCEALDSVTVDVKAAPVFTVSPANPSVCLSNSIQLVAGGGDKFSWYPSTFLSDPNISNPFSTPSSNITYAVTITDTYYNIVSTLQVPVTIKPNPVINLSKDNDLSCTQPFAQLHASGAASYIWSPSAGLNNPRIPNPVASGNSTITYYVDAFSGNGCVSKDSLVVKFTNSGDISKMELPTAFTPNGDGLNDCFGLRKWGAVDVVSFRVYNRWGEIVFNAKSATDCWDGKYKGIPQQTGAFVYMLKVKTACGDVERKGTIVLLR